MTTLVSKVSAPIIPEIPASVTVSQQGIPQNPVAQVAQTVLQENTVDDSQLSRKRKVSSFTDLSEEQPSKLRKLSPDNEIETPDAEVIAAPQQQTTPFDARKADLIAKIGTWHKDMLAALSGFAWILHRSIVNSDVKGLKNKLEQVTSESGLKDLLQTYKEKLVAKGKFLTGKSAKEALANGLKMIEEVLDSISSKTSSEKAES